MLSLDHIVTKVISIDIIFTIPSSPLGPNPSLPDTCEYFSINCDENLNYCLLSCRGPCVPFSLVVKYDRDTVHKRFFQPLKFLEVNVNLRTAVADLCLPKSQSFQVPADTETGAPALNGIMLQPPDFDSSKHYPVLVYVYGGPNSQTVSQSNSYRFKFIHPALLISTSAYRTIASA